MIVITYKIDNKDIKIHFSELNYNIYLINILINLFYQLPNKLL